jgi:hypothetical protein
VQARAVDAVVLAATFATVAGTMTDEQCYEAAARLRALNGDKSTRAFYRRAAEALEGAASNPARKGSDD